MSHPLHKVHANSPEDAMYVRLNLLLGPIMPVQLLA